MVLDEAFALSNGVEIPKLGLGTWFIDDDKAADAVREAVRLGYRHFDTAQAYENERGVGEGVRTADVPRDQLFVTTKLAAEAKDYHGAVKAIDGSLAKAGLDYFDLMLIHAPQPWDDFRGGDYSKGNREAWKALADAYQAGKLRSIGVANFKKEDIENLTAAGLPKPMVNQILVHISNTPLDLIEYCQQEGILVEGYSPVAHGKILGNAQIKAMADRYGVSVAQLCIRYDLQLGALPLPKTANPDHMRENAAIDFEISGEDMEALKGIAPIENYGEFSFFPVFSGK